MTTAADLKVTTCPAPGCDEPVEPDAGRCWIHKPAATTINLEPDVAPKERQPGEFARHPHTGAPYVAHPTETTKRGQPKRVMYGRPSGLGKQIENATNLQKWAERMVAVGVGMDEGLAQAARQLAEFDSESPEFRLAADKLAVDAKQLAGATLAADRGTHHHELTEDFDQDRDPIARMAAGEELGVPIAAQKALLWAWDQTLHATGLEVLATEATVVDDKWRQAGTLDRVARLTRPLRFTTGEGEIVELPAGTVIVLDLKTGKLRLNDKGHPLYWHTYAVQVASYAQSVPYDPDTDERGEWPWEIDQRWGIIAHLDVRAALDGEAVCQLIAVDLEAGRHAGELCVAAKDWEKRCDVFGLVDDARITVTVEESGPTHISAVLPAAVAAIAQPTTTPGFRAVVANRLERLKRDQPAAAATLKDRWPAGVPGMKGDHAHTDVELQRIIGALEAAEAETKPTTVDEGRAMSNEDVAGIIKRFDALDAEKRAVLNGWAKEAKEAGVAFNLRLVPSQRRFEIYRACLELAYFIEDDDLDCCRGAVATVVPTAAFPTVPIGHALGSLTIAEAEQLTAVAIAARNGEAALQYDLEGGVRWAFPTNQTDQTEGTNQT